MNDAPITVVVADDQEVTRAGILAMLQSAPDIQLVGETDSGAEVQTLIARLKPHVLVLDSIMPGLSLAEIVLWAAQHYPETAVLILMAHDSDCYLAQMVEVGAAGYLDKNERAQHLADAIRRAADGQVVITQEQQRRVQRWRTEVQSRWACLTAREQEVLCAIAQGVSIPEIAQQLHISPHTVGTHLRNLMSKLQVYNRAEVVAWAWNNGIVEATSLEK